MLALGARVGGQENVEQRVEIDVSLGWKRDGKAVTDRVTVAASNALTVEIARVDEIGHDPLRRSLGDLHLGCDVPHPNAGVVGDAQQGQTVVGKKPKRPHAI